MKQLGIVTIMVSFVSSFVFDGIYHVFHLAEEWNRYDDAGGITFGICLILLSMVVRYGAELEHKTRMK